jgi:hypothetical protein
MMRLFSIVFIHTKYGEPIVIMVFRRAIQKVLCLTPSRLSSVSISSARSPFGSFGTARRGRKPPLLAAKRPARPHKRAIQKRFTAGNTKGA